jgi:hypothetical protein
VLGPTRDLPVASHDVVDGWGLRIPIPSEAIVMDGYKHWLQVDGSTGRIYIVQVGGFAGFMTVFGPFENDGCRLSLPDQVPWFWDLA